VYSCPERSDKRNSGQGLKNQGMGFRSNEEIALPIFNMKAMENPEMKNIWIGDSGASWHYVSSDQGMYNCKPCDDKITIANGNTIQVEKQGKI